MEKADSLNSLKIENLVSPQRLDPDVQLAAEALETLSSGTPKVLFDEQSNEANETFIKRVSSIPLINKSMQNIQTYYEAVQNYRMVKYSAETVETISKPILDRFGDSLDKFACSQLDRLEKSFPSLTKGSEGETLSSQSLDLQGSIGYDPMNISDGMSMEIEKQPTGIRSRWSSVVAGVQNNWGAMVISDDVMRGLRYCLQWLQYAINHIDHHISILRQYLTKAIVDQNGSSDTLVPHSHFYEYLSQIKREVVETVRKVVEVIGRYAAMYLPGEARTSVRGFILSLPSRWASLNRVNEPSTPTPSTSSTCSEYETETQKVISFGEESSNMLKGVHAVFSQTVDGAEMYLGKSLDEDASSDIEMR